MRQSNAVIDCAVYKGKRRPDYYLYIERAHEFARVPESLLAIMGELEHVLDVQLDAKRQLAQVDVRDVMRQLQETGYYLQMPPGNKPDEKIQ